MISTGDISAEAMADTQAVVPECSSGNHRGCASPPISPTSPSKVSCSASATKFIQQQATYRFHLLFNNAAGIGGGGSLFTNTAKQRERTLTFCWGGVYSGVRTLLPPLLVKADEGSIVYISSVNGFRATVGLGVLLSSYSAARFAVKGSPKP